jgi:hypothetical protein
LKQPTTEEFIVKTQRHTTYRSLPLQGQCAFVRAAVVGSPFGMPWATCTMNERHSISSQRPIASLGYEDWMHPGKGGA